MNLARTLAYGMPGLPLAFAALPLYLHVPHFYTRTTGLELGLLGGILLAARLLDAVTDPGLGWLADRLPRPRLLALALPALGLGFFALLHPPGGASDTATALWLLASLGLTYLGFSAATIAHQAWGADLGRNARQRTRLNATREGFGLVGIVLAAALPGWLASDAMQGIVALSWLLPPLLLIGAVTAFVGAGRAPALASPPPPLMRSLRQVLGNAVFRRLLLVFVTNGLAAALPATLFLFFVTDVLQTPAAAGPLLALYFVAGAASLPLWVALAARQGRVHAWGLAMGLAVIAFAGASLLGPGDVAAFAVICLLSGLALGADLAMPVAIAADLGERLGQAGACFGVWNFAAKLNLALAAGLALPLLAASGYQPGAGGVSPALTFAYALLPLGIKTLALALLWRWRHSLDIR